MARLELEMESDLPPERILSALTDFTPRRPDLWPGLNANAYHVYELGDTYAVVREGSGGPIWARERYDWSKTGNVTWTVQESGFSSPGDFVSADVTTRAGGGSRIHVTWSRRGRNLIGWFAVLVIVIMRGGPVRGSVQAGLDRLAELAANDASPTT